jgi:hypothetical protein
MHCLAGSGTAVAPRDDGCGLLSAGCLVAFFDRATCAAARCGAAGTCASDKRWGGGPCAAALTRPGRRPLCAACGQAQGSWHMCCYSAGGCWSRCRARAGVLLPSTGQLVHVPVQPQGYHAANNEHCALRGRVSDGAATARLRGFLSGGSHMLIASESILHCSRMQYTNDEGVPSCSSLVCAVVTCWQQRTRANGQMQWLGRPSFVQNVAYCMCL